MSSLTSNEIKLFGDGIGSVRLIESFGNDETVVQAARVSYTNRPTSSDARTLIRYLYSNRHTSPFEQVVFRFEVVAPVFVARQWLRHRTAHVNEQSARYSVLEDRFYYPRWDVVCNQSVVNKQGRTLGETHPSAVAFVNELRRVCEIAYRVYINAVEAGIAREIARMVLPVNIYTKFIWTIDLHNLLHFLSLRMDEHAQWEIQQYAHAIYTLIQPIVPQTVAAFENYTISGIRLSGEELENDSANMSNREKQAFTEKKDRLKPLTDAIYSQPESGARK